MNFSDIHTTDSGNAEVIAKLYGARLRYDHARKGWLVWNGHYWKADELCSVEQMALKAARERLKSSADIDDGPDRNRGRSVEGDDAIRYSKSFVKPPFDKISRINHVVLGRRPASIIFRGEGSVTFAPLNSRHYITIQFLLRADK